ncbi:MAG: zinc ABC transporter substrate-binding protein ZnuA [Oceanospirillaceae bacterium]|nr:zinc ABC transporter substrate-binding protein ZnuA [Oceanospirillaceae bacterium]
MNLSAKLSKLLPILGLCSAIGLNAQASGATYAEPGFILTSIKPLQLIAQDITQGVIESVVLLPPGASPHAYALRPSEVKDIYNAKSIYWVGHQLESFLQKPFSKHPQKTHALASLGDFNPVTAAANGHNPNAEAHDEHEDHEGHDDDDTDIHLEDDHSNPVHVHHYQGRDPHIWLSPTVALLIAQEIKTQTTALYPQHQAQLAANYAAFEASLEKVDLSLKAQFSPLKALGFLVFHDAYSRFIEHYQLNQIGALTINPAKRPGAKHLAQIRRQIKQSAPVCIFSEPQFSKVAIQTVMRDTQLRSAELDPLATQVTAEKARYASFLADFGQRIISCLGGFPRTD